MAAVSASLVKQLREATGAGMMDCKTALAESDGDMEAAKDWLRKKGLSKAAKKAGRATAEGLVAAVTSGNRGAMVEVNSETDFVARNDQFQAFVDNVAQLALTAGTDVESLKAATYPDTGRTVADEVTQQIATIGENLDVRRSVTRSVDQGVVAAYVHNPVKTGLGKMGVLVALESAAAGDELQRLAKNLAMHVAATQPSAVSRDDVDAQQVQRERDVLAEQARASGKPENIIEKMVEGRLRKFYEEVCLLEQVYVVDGESRVQDVIAQAEKDLGASIKLAGFDLFVLGAGKDSGGAEGAEAEGQAAG